AGTRYRAAGDYGELSAPERRPAAPPPVERPKPQALTPTARALTQRARRAHAEPPPPPSKTVKKGSLRPEGAELRIAIERILRRGQPRTVRELAADLVVPAAEVAQQVQYMRGRGERGQ